MCVFVQNATGWSWISDNGSPAWGFQGDYVMWALNQPVFPPIGLGSYYLSYVKNVTAGNDGWAVQQATTSDGSRLSVICQVPVTPAQSG